MNWSSLATGLLALALSAPALAVDGVAEINHTCATLTGCFPGDTPGYPVRIDGQAGSSYRLTSDLIVPEEDVDGINTSASNLRIDLNGFQIVRAGCENLLTCTVLSGNGTGIHASARGVTVVNGSVIGMGDRGVRIVGFGGLVRGVQTRFNGGNGIDVDNASIVEKCESLSNGGHGIEGRGSTVLESAVRANVGDGIFDGGDAAIVARNTVRFQRRQRHHGRCGQPRREQRGLGQHGFRPEHPGRRRLPRQHRPEQHGWHGLERHPARLEPLQRHDHLPLELPAC